MPLISPVDGTTRSVLGLGQGDTDWDSCTKNSFQENVKPIKAFPAPLDVQGNMKRMTTLRIWAHKVQDMIGHKLCSCSRREDLLDFQMLLASKVSCLEGNDELHVEGDDHVLGELLFRPWQFDAIGGSHEGRYQVAFDQDLFTNETRRQVWAPVGGDDFSLAHGVPRNGRRLRLGRLFSRSKAISTCIAT